jgi:hypothetical protein
LKTLIRNFFFSNWERKAVSTVLAIIIWLIVNHSLSTTKTFEEIPVRVLNIPVGMTIEGIQSNHLLQHRIAITVSGNKALLEEISPSDLEVLVDATDKVGNFTTLISKKNLVSLNPDLDLGKAILRVFSTRLSLALTKLITAKVPIHVGLPIGEAPADYQVLDVWPYKLQLTVSGPEETIKKIQATGLNLAFNLSNITRDQLDRMEPTSADGKNDALAFLVPKEWKTVSIPALSHLPFVIDDPQAEFLRIDFIRSEFHPIAKEIPISLFFPKDSLLNLNPKTCSLLTQGLIELVHGVPMLRKTVYAKGVSHLFAELVRDMLEISIVVAPKNENNELDWGVHLINHRALEDLYVSMLISDFSENSSLPRREQEEYLRNRFRNYMNRLQLYKAYETRLNLQPKLRQNQVLISEGI